MKRIHLLLAVTSLTVVSAAAFLPAPAWASAPASVPTCGGTSLVQGFSRTGIVYIRVPTVGNATPSKWGCDLFPSSVAGLVPVERLQIDLNNCYGDNLAVDGEYGINTENAVKAVQRSEGVPVDGDYGPQTIRGTLAGGAFLYQESGQPARTCTTIQGLP